MEGGLIKVKVNHIMLSSYLNFKWKHPWLEYSYQNIQKNIGQETQQCDWAIQKVKCQPPGKQ